MLQQPKTLAKTIRVDVRIKYLLYLPERYSKTQKRWPLILFLHGAGERGNDLEKVKIHGPPKLIAEQGWQLPFIVVSPQCPERDWWGDAMMIHALNALLDEIVARYRADRSRIYVTGLSMGGFGTWLLANEYPARFAAIAPICGGGNPLLAGRISRVPAWVFHGARDEAVPLKKSEEMVAALKQAGGDVTFTVYPDAGHDSWSAAYANPALYEWFLKHSLKRGK